MAVFILMSTVFVSVLCSLKSKTSTPDKSEKGNKGFAVKFRKNYNF